MTKTVELTDLIINRMLIDYDMQCVIADFSFTDSDLKVWDTGRAIFWVTIPQPGNDENGNPIPIPDEWFLLPTGYIPTLVSLQNDADAALTAKYLV